jgi:hypothetical protein
LVVLAIEPHQSSSFSSMARTNCKGTRIDCVPTTQPLSGPQLSGDCRPMLASGLCKLPVVSTSCAIDALLSDSAPDPPKQLSVFEWLSNAPSLCSFPKFNFSQQVGLCVTDNPRRTFARLSNLHSWKSSDRSGKIPTDHRLLLE